MRNASKDLEPRLLARSGAGRIPGQDEDCDPPPDENIDEDA
jgi:hypothetical protein